MYKYFFTLLVFVLAAVIFYVKSRVEPASWVNIWGIYFFIVPFLSFLSIILFRDQFDYKYSIMYALGVLISILLFRGNWADNYVMYKIIATLSGAFVSFLIYLWTKR